MRVGSGGHLVDLALLDNVVGVGAGEPGRLEEVHDLGPWHHPFVQEVVVLLGADDSAQEHFILVDRQPTVRIVKDDLHVGRDHAGSCALVKQGLSLFWPQVRVVIGKHELDGVEEVGLARAVSSHHDIVAGIKGLDDSLFSVGLEARDDHLFDVHVGGRRFPAHSLPLEKSHCLLSLESIRLEDRARPQSNRRPRCRRSSSLADGRGNTKSHKKVETIRKYTRNSLDFMEFSFLFCCQNFRLLFC